MNSEGNMPQELIDGQWKPGKWHEYDQLTCVNCQWDTLEGIEAARAHRATCPRCAPPVEPPPPPRMVFVADRWGNPVGTPEIPVIVEENDGATDIN